MPRLKVEILGYSKSCRKAQIGKGVAFSRLIKDLGRDFVFLRVLKK